MCFHHLLPQCRVSPTPGRGSAGLSTDLPEEPPWSLSWGAVDVRADCMQPWLYSSFIRCTCIYGGAWGQPGPLVLGEDAPKALTGSRWTVRPICTSSGPRGIAFSEEHFRDRWWSDAEACAKTNPRKRRMVLNILSLSHSWFYLTCPTSTLVS